MKKHIALGLVVSTLFLAGCCKSHDASAWEYKTYQGYTGGQQPVEAELNKLQADGWRVQSFSAIANSPGYYLFLLERRKQ
jgi:hypothetical protein